MWSPRSHGVDPRDRQHAGDSSDGRTAALDLRIVDQQATGASKLDVAADGNAAIWQEHREAVFPAADGSDHQLVVRCRSCSATSARPCGLERLRRAARPAGRRGPAPQLGAVHPRSQRRPSQGHLVRGVPRWSTFGAIMEARDTPMAESARRRRGKAELCPGLLTLSLGRAAHEAVTSSPAPMVKRTLVAPRVLGRSIHATSVTPECVVR